MSTLKTPFRYDFVGSLKQQKKRLKKEQSHRKNSTA